MNGRRFRAPVFVTVITAVVISALLGLAGPAQAAAPQCGITWGSQPSVHTAPEYSGPWIYDIRSGRHACYDRLVIDIAEVGSFDTWSVRYVDTARGIGSGDPIATRGGAVLEVDLAAGVLNGDNVTYTPADPSEVVRVGGYQTFRQVVWAGSYEGHTALGIGTRARLPFRVFTVASAPGDVRLVIDVAHRW
jgi:hypothetical protein